MGCIFFDSGLPCVCILIGVFLKSTGQPIAGVVNQPFHQENNERLIFGTRPSFDQFSKWTPTCFRWSGRRLWGLRHGDVSMNNITSQLTSDATQTLTMSSSEGKKIREKLRGISSWWTRAGLATRCCVLSMGECNTRHVTPLHSCFWCNRNFSEY